MTGELTPAKLGVRCPLWCDGDHPRFDQHMSTCWMCFIPLVTDSSFVDIASRTVELNGAAEELQLYLAQDLREIGPRIVLEHLRAGYPRLSILPNEALHFSDALRRLATMAVDPHKSVKCQPCDHHPS